MIQTLLGNALASLRRLPDLRAAIEGVILFLAVVGAGIWAVQMGVLKLDPVPSAMSAHFAVGFSAIVVYVCFERLSDGHFAVQQAEFVYGRSAAERDVEVARIAAQTLELFAEGKVADTQQWSASIAEAIARHDSEFGT